MTQAGHGTVEIVDAAAGTVKYTPDADFNGQDSYTYTVTSGGVSETATVTVSVTAVDDPATIGGDSSGTGDEDTLISGTLTATDVADGMSDGSYFTIESGDNAAHGTASIDAATGAWSYTPDADYNGADSFTVTVTDDAGNTATQVVSVSVSAVADITDDTAEVAEDGSVTTDVLANDTFEDTGRTIVSVTQAGHGTVEIVDAAAGTVKYTPDADFNGQDSYTYTVTSGGVSETATVTVSVTAVDDPATIGGDSSGTGNEDTLISGTLTATDDADGMSDGSYFTIESGDNAAHGTASIDAATGAWSYTPDADYHGTDSFKVTVTGRCGQHRNSGGLGIGECGGGYPNPERCRCDGHFRFPCGSDHILPPIGYRRFGNPFFGH